MSSSIAFVIVLIWINPFDKKKARITGLDLPSYPNWALLLVVSHQFLQLCLMVRGHHHLPLTLIIMFKEGRAVDFCILVLKRISSVLCLSLKILWKTQYCSKECPSCRWYGQYFKYFRSLAEGRDSTSGNWMTSFWSNRSSKAIICFSPEGNGRRMVKLLASSLLLPFSPFLVLNWRFGSHALLYSQNQRSLLWRWSNYYIGPSSPLHKVISSPFSFHQLQKRCKGQIFKMDSIFLYHTVKANMHQHILSYWIASI